MTTVLFSVSPNHNPTGTLVPSAQMASATTQHCSAKKTPSIIIAATRRSVRSRAINSSRALVVAALKRRDTAERDVEADAAVTCSPTGSATERCRRVATPASIRSMTTWLSRSSLLNVA